MTTDEGTAGAAGANGAAAAAPAAAPAAGAAPSWTDGFSPELKGYVELRQFKDAATVAESYRNMEKLQGVPLERLLKLPEKMDDPAMNVIYDRLGRPKEAKEYKVTIPEGADPKFAEWAQNQFHGLGLSRTQGEKLATAWNEFTGAQTKAQEAAQLTELKGQEAVLHKEWGAAYDQNLKLADDACEKLGISEEHAMALRDAMGAADAVKFLYSLGTKIGEDKFISGDGARGFNGAILTPNAAKNQISALSKDTSFAKRLISGDVHAREEWNKLHEQAYQEAN